MDTWQEALAVENASPFGNAASIYTTSGAAADFFQTRFRAGMIGERGANVYSYSKSFMCTAVCSAAVPQKCQKYAGMRRDAPDLTARVRERGCAPAAVPFPARNVSYRIPHG